MSSKQASRYGAPCPQRQTERVRGSTALTLVTALNLSLILALNCTPAAARSKLSHKPDHKGTEHANKEPFGDIKKGPLQIFISINQQKLHLYSDGVHVADTSVATGVPSLPTPLGVFDVIQKQVFHRSNIYSNAPMPYMQRITWSGVALHEGESIGHRASHGCIRMPHDFAVRLYKLTKLGARVIIANSELKPAEFADPHLFVHKDKAPDLIAAVPAGSQPAQKADGEKTIGSAPVDAAVTEQPAVLGLRVGDRTAAADDAAKSDSATTETPESAAKPDAKLEAPVAAAQIASNAMPASAVVEQKSEPAPPNGGAPAVAAADDSVPKPPSKLAEPTKDAPNKGMPISIFISRKEKKIYVRQNFQPIFEAPVTIARPNEPLGTHVFTAMEFLDDHATFRWTVVSLPGESPKQVREANNSRQQHIRNRRRAEDNDKPIANPPPSPTEALDRIDIPQDARDYIFELMVPGSSLIVSDHGLGGETGEGTDFIVVSR